ncbi:MAG: hypothetical protein HKP61_13470 [Dactylosporangium sp.]|nr:hypothetical protein [Dactylosporangium sp.]NNJ61925.1 hypothetical protein [Dactylosporangium sp.]
MSGALDRLNDNLINAANAVPAEQVAAAKQRVDALIAVFDQATQPSRHPDVVAALARMRHASAALGRAQGRAREIVTALAAYGDKLYLHRPIRRTLAPASAPPGTPSSASVRESSERPGFDPRPDFDDMPVFDRDGTGPASKTHGRWTDANGVTHKLLSGWHDGYHVAVNQFAIRLGVIPAHGRLERAGDIELKFALGMRGRWQRTGTAPRETIIINHPDGPCQGKLSCDGLLHRYLPPGGELTVHWPGGNKRTYRGDQDQ